MWPQNHHYSPYQEKSLTTEQPTPKMVLALTRARGFWNGTQDAFFDVRVFHPNASSYRSVSLQAAFRRHEQTKKREYGERVREVEHGVFTPLVLSTTGGLGVEATTFYKRLADLISLKQQKHYSTVMCWLRCRLSFAVLRSAIMCVRGSRSSRPPPFRARFYYAHA